MTLDIITFALGSFFYFLSIRIHLVEFYRLRTQPKYFLCSFMFFSWNFISLSILIVWYDKRAQIHKYCCLKYWCSSLIYILNFALISYWSFKKRISISFQVCQAKHSSTSNSAPQSKTSSASLSFKLAALSHNYFWICSSFCIIPYVVGLIYFTSMIYHRGVLYLNRGPPLPYWY